MGVLSTRNITKEDVFQLNDASKPENGVVLQVRAGKVVEGALGGEITSAIYKQEHKGPVFCTLTGIQGDEHAAKSHGGIERAVHQYNATHYADWRKENAPEPDLYSLGGFGENLVTTGMDENNVCIGDVYRLGDEIILKVSEPRHPCYKLNSRFKWPRALKRTIRSGRSGWNFCVLRTGNVQKGQSLTLMERPHPRWSIMNVQRVIRGKRVSLDLLAECSQLPMPAMWLEIVGDRLRRDPKPYTLVESRDETDRVKKLTFELKGDLTLSNPEFDSYGFAQITFGPDSKFARSYSVVEGDMYRFSLGVALDRQSRGGSAYIHHDLKIGDEISMAPGSNSGAIENDKKCRKDQERILIVGGIGITAFLPSIRSWRCQGLPFHLHYAVPSVEEAAFLGELPPYNVTLYAKSEKQRLNLRSVVPEFDPNNTHQARIFCCGPAGMMNECQDITNELGYPEHMVHFEDFGGGSGGGILGEPFEIEIDEPETNRHATLMVPSNTSMLNVLTEAGFDIEWSCRPGACGACKVTVCEGKVNYKSTSLVKSEKGIAMQTCVDRGIGKLKIEVD